MPDVLRSWAFVLALLLIGLTACASQPVPALPTPTVPLRDAVVALPTLLADPQRWSGQPLILIAPVQAGEQTLSAQIVSAPGATPAAAPDATAIWLAQPLPDSITQQFEDGFGVVRLRGRLSPPGAYGRDQRFSYQFSAERADLLQPERTTLVNLTTNPGALNGVLLRLEGTLLVQRDAALLADHVSAGGVPTASGRQIKLPRNAIDEQIVAQLSRSGEVRWGAVQVIGWWQDGALMPFAITTADSPSPSTP